MATIEELKKIASQVRRDIVRMVTTAKSGHPGGSMGITDVMTTLYFNEMQHDPKTWTRSAHGQDVFLLSAGHLAPVYYSVLARAGYFPISELGTLRKFGSRLQGHPCVTDSLPGVFKPSGSLGQGLSVAAGIALGKKMDGEDNRVYCLCGDGESEEGQIWEAGMWAAHHQVDNLIAFTDWNGQQIDGPTTSITAIEDLSEKWGAFGWDVIIADGHDFQSILDAFQVAHNKNGKPKMILFKTIMGQGVDFMAGTHVWHGKAPSADQCAAAMTQLEETLGDY
ncbi:MAG: transketolase [Bacteroidales bacterium]|jgi:transketolase|nr:transketolase [Bacteroidales bacterium]MBQ2006993.1 transketolase [Bacteroidales bacterium]MBQ5583022.1 transketolase [Bacteroidales bacterium]MBQ5639395.1 transketolase [Bacteroidales bacterium]